MTAAGVGFLPAKSPLHPTTLGNQIKGAKNHGKSSVGITPEMKPRGSAAGNTGRAMR